MAWSDSAASRRALLGQLAGQLTEAQKLKGAKKQQRRDIMAGYGQQLVGFLGKRKLQTQAEAAESELAGEKSRLRQEENVALEALRQGGVAALEQLRQKGIISADAARLAAETAETEKLQETSGLPWMQFIHGYKPREPGKEEITDMEKALSDPVGWVTGMMYTFRENEQIVEALTDEQWAAFERWGKGLIPLQFPDMDKVDQERLEFAIDLAVAERGAGIEEVAAGERGKGFVRIPHEERTRMLNEVKQMVSDLREMGASLSGRDPSMATNSRLLIDSIPLMENLPRATTGSEEAFNDWARRARQILQRGETMLPAHEQRRGSTSPLEAIQEQLQPSHYRTHPH